MAKDKNKGGSEKKKASGVGGKSKKSRHQRKVEHKQFLNGMRSGKMADSAPQ